MKKRHRSSARPGDKTNGARPPSEAAPNGDLRFLDPAGIVARRDPWGKLVMMLSGERGPRTLDGVRPLRAFPLTAPDQQIVLVDEEDQELGIIRDLQELDPESRAALEAELEIVYLATRVQSIRLVRSRFGVTTWELDTDRGRRTAHVKERSDIRTLPDGRIILSDVDGVRYEIPPPQELDERSRGWLMIEA
jgi:hypothetical protein